METEERTLLTEQKVIELATQQLSWKFERDGMRARIVPVPGSEPRKYQLKMELIDGSM